MDKRKNMYGVCRNWIKKEYAWSVSELDKRKKIKEPKRHGVQALWALLTNSYLAGFLQGKIYQGKLKTLCVPGLNCYSCPGAVGACPIGAMQAVIGSWNFKFAFYVAGFLMFVGGLMGRFVCGWLCPFGLIQDLLHKLPFWKSLRLLGAIVCFGN